jgi:hypothetical protein
MINYTFSSKPVKNFEGRQFHSILENDVKVVGFSEIIREIPPIMYFNGTAIIFKEVVLTKGEIFGGIIRGGELAGAKISGGEINGGSLQFGQMLGGVFNSGLLLGGTIYSGVFNGAEIRGGDFYGGVFNKGVRIFNGKWERGIYTETPMQVQSKDYFCYMQNTFNDIPQILTIGCESHPLDEFDCDAIYEDRYIDKFSLKHVQEIKDLKQLFSSYYGNNNS